MAEKSLRNSVSERRKPSYVNTTDFVLPTGLEIRFPGPIPVIGFALRFYRWLHIRRIDRFHRALGSLERELARSTDRSRIIEYRARIAKIESAVRLLKVTRSFEVDLHRLMIHLHMVQEDINRRLSNHT